jgi:phage FluMu gp28-like protein
LAIGVLIAIMSYVVAFMETFTIQNVSALPQATRASGAHARTMT